MLQTSLAAGGEWYKVDMDMRRRFVHMKVSGEHSQVGIALLEALIVFVEDCPRKLGVFSCRRHIVLVAYLEDDLVEQLFLLSGLNMLVIIGYLSVLAFLFIVVLFQSFIKHFVIHFLDWLITVIYIQMGTLAVHVLRRKRSAVVRDRAFTHHCANRSLHLSTSNLYYNNVISLNFL